MSLSRKLSAVVTLTVCFKALGGVDPLLKGIDGHLITQYAGDLQGLGVYVGVDDVAQILHVEPVESTYGVTHAVVVARLFLWE